MKCPKCGSKETVPHTDSELRKVQDYIYQCFVCDTWWRTHYEIVEVFVDFIKTVESKEVETE